MAFDLFMIAWEWWRRELLLALARSRGLEAQNIAVGTWGGGQDRSPKHTKTYEND